jgi:hypothetical protein
MKAFVKKPKTFSLTIHPSDITRSALMVALQRFFEARKFFVYFSLSRYSEQRSDELCLPMRIVPS